MVAEGPPLSSSGDGRAFVLVREIVLGRFHELSERNRLARAGKTFLVNKYYLDDLYTGAVVGSIKGPIAQAAYWVNQNVIDGVVNGAAIASRYAAGFVYDFIDQKIVDGAVNGIGYASEEGGVVLRKTQTGRVQQYAAVLFGALVVFGAALIAFT